jgi:hypothetical protein
MPSTDDSALGGWRSLRREGLGGRELVVGGKGKQGGCRRGGLGARAGCGYQAMLVTGPSVAGRTGGGLRLSPEPMTQNDLALTTSDR